MAPLRWLPKEVTATTDAWEWQDTLTTGLGSLVEAGRSIMKPVGEQVADAMRTAMPPPPAPPPPPPPPPPRPEIPAIAPFDLGTIEDWGMAAPRPAPAPGPTAATETVAPARPQQEAGFRLPDVSAFLPGAAPSPTAGRAGPAAAGPAPSYAGGSWEQKAHAAAVAAGHPNPAEFVEQMRQESGFAPDVIAGKRASSAGALGIAQIMPATAKAWGVDPLDPDAALAAAAKAMAGYYATYGDSDRALAAYNMGPGNLQKYGPKGLPETRSYIEIIQGKTPKGAPAPAAAPAPGRAAAAPGLDVGGITKAYAGVPYTFGGPGGRGQGLGATTDCSGFVSAVWKDQFGLDLPAHTDTSYTALRKLGAAEVSAADARPGDVVYYMGAGTGGAITHHMGIYAGPGKVLDMSTSGQSGAQVRDLNHAGRHVILRDPRVNQQAPPAAQAPRPIVASGIAERTGGEAMRTVQARAPEIAAEIRAPSAAPGPLAAPIGAPAAAAPPQPTYAAPFQDTFTPEPAAAPSDDGGEGALAQAFRQVNGRLPSVQELADLARGVFGGIG